MSKIHIFSLAKELGIDSKVLIEHCHAAGLMVKSSALASISPEEKQLVLEHIAAREKKVARPAAIKIRIFSLAKELGLDSKVLIDQCRATGLEVKGSALASISPEEKKLVLAHFAKRKRAFVVAKELGIDPLQIVDLCRSAGISLSSPLGTITNLEQEKIAAKIYTQRIAEQDQTPVVTPAASVSTEQDGETKNVSIQSAAPLTQVHEISDGQKGNTYDSLFGKYVCGISRVEITDPYICRDYQFRNLAELLEMIYRQSASLKQVDVVLTTKTDKRSAKKQAERLGLIQSAFTEGTNIAFAWRFSESIHDRSIIATPWKILIGRGLDIFQSINNPYALENRYQKLRQCRETSITYVKQSHIAGEK